MAISLGTIIIALVGGVLLYVGHNYVQDWLRERKFVQTHGCKKPVVLKNSLPFGLERYFLLVDSVDREVLPEFNRDLHKTVGNTYEVSMLGMTTIQTTEPRNVQAILATQFKEFGLGPTRYGSFHPLLGDGIFTLDGKGWEMSRTLLRPQFSREQISHLKSLEDHIQLLFKCIPTDGSVVDIQELFFRLSLDTATEFLFGESVNSLSQGTESKIGISEATDASTGKKGFAQAFNEAQTHLMGRVRLRSLYWAHNPQEFKDVNIICKDFVDHFVHKALANNAQQATEKSQSDSPEKQRYVFLEALGKESRDPILLRDQCMNILLAGRDTTASLLSWTFNLLGRHPEITQKLRQAILADFGEEDSSTILTFEQLKSSVYLRYVINEALRLFPVVPFNGRTALKDTTIPVGGGPDGKSPVFVRKGQNVEYSVYSMHRREDIWGPDASFFRPERWAEPRKTGYGGFEYLPFNGGPRICLGQQFALTEASYTIVKMFQHFKRMELINYDVDYKSNVTLTMCCGKNGVNMKMFTE